MGFHYVCHLGGGGHIFQELTRNDTPIIKESTSLKVGPDWNIERSADECHLDKFRPNKRCLNKFHIYKAALKVIKVLAKHISL